MNGCLIFILVLGTLSSGVTQTSTARGRDQGHVEGTQPHCATVWEIVGQGAQP